jgi:putative flippase GtrA
MRNAWRRGMNSSIVKYGAVGLLGTLIHWGVLILLVEAWDFDPVWGTTIGFIVTLLVSFILNNEWTFMASVARSNVKPFIRFMRYVVISLFGLLLNTGIMYLFVHIWELPYLVGQCVSLFVVPLSNYMFNSKWTFQ